MVRAEQRKAPIARRIALWRILSFVLLLLALVGYAGLPSVPANGLHISLSLSAEVKADPASPYNYSAPQQEQEYRERDVDLLTGLAGHGDAPDVLAQPASQLSPPFSHVAPGRPLPPMVASQSLLPASARAPPVPVTVRALHA